MIGRRIIAFQNHPLLHLGSGFLDMTEQLDILIGMGDWRPDTVVQVAWPTGTNVIFSGDVPVPVTIRAYPLGWSQADGEDRYEESPAVIVSPPIFTIPPGGTQLVRVGLRSPSAAPRAFRLIVEEVPQARPDGGIQVALRLNLPLYIGIEPGEAAALSWSASAEADGSWTIEAANRGTGYVRLDPAAASAATGIAFADEIAFGTVLPGATRRWRIGAAPTVRDEATFRRIARGQGRDAMAAARN